jgi:hypothetical protein
MAKKRNAVDTAKRVDVAKKMDETAYFVEPMTNSYNGERQIQINDTFIPKGETELQYGRRGININVIDIPAVMQALATMYADETGNKIELE